VVTVHEPYCALVHSRSQLQELSTKLNTLSREQQNDNGNVDPEVEEKSHHLNVLLDFIRPYMDRFVPKAERRLLKPEPTVTFDMIWYHLNPGKFCYCLFDEQLIGCVVLSVKGKSDKNRPDSDKIVRWNVRLWFLDVRGGKLHRGFTKRSIPAFEGQKAVTTLPVIPREYWDRADGGARKKHFEKRGRKKLEVLKQDHLQLDYDGQSLEETRRTVSLI
jgi:hypothetical protein